MSLAGNWMDACTEAQEMTKFYVEGDCSFLPHSLSPELMLRSFEHTLGSGALAARVPCEVIPIPTACAPDNRVFGSLVVGAPGGGGGRQLRFVGAWSLR